MAGLETVMTAELICVSGAGVVNLQVDPIPIFVEGQIAGKISDGVGVINIPAFNACDVMGTCVPLTVAWLPGDPTVLMNGIPSLAQPSLAPCLAAIAVAVATEGDDPGLAPTIVLIACPNNFSVFV